MGLTSPGRALGRSSLRSIFLKLLTLSGILPCSIKSFRLASLLAVLVGLNLSFVIGMVYQNHKSRFFRVRRGVPQGSVFGPVLFSPSMIFWLLWLLPLPVRSGGGHTRSSVSIGAGLNVRSPQLIATKLTSSPNCFYSAPAFVSFPLQVLLGLPSTALFPFLNMHFTEGQIPPTSQGLMLYLCFLMGAPLRSLLCSV